MTQKSWRASLAEAYRWVIAATLGAVFGSLNLPELETYLREPIVGAAVMLLLLLVVLIMVIFATVVDQMVDQFAGPSEPDPLDELLDVLKSEDANELRLQAVETTDDE